jgi:hypothetical protein
MFASGRTTTAAARQSLRTFSTTPTCRSKIGSAPLSLPQEVKFNIIPRATTAGGATARRGRGGVSQSGQGSTVEISGPLGTMKMAIPAYMSIQENEANRTRTLHILDAEDRKQREMWGEFESHQRVAHVVLGRRSRFFCIARTVLLTQHSQAPSEHTSQTTFSA